jgi:hypothetical protein
MLVQGEGCSRNTTSDKDSNMPKRIARLSCYRLDGCSLMMCNVLSLLCGGVDEDIISFVSNEHKWDT